MGPCGSPGFSGAGKTEPPSRFTLSQTSAGTETACSERSGGARECRLEPSAAGQDAPGDAGQFIGEGDRQHIVMEPLAGRLDPGLEPVPLPVLLSHQHDPGSLDEEGPQVAVAALRYRAEDGTVSLSERS